MEDKNVSDLLWRLWSGSEAIDIGAWLSPFNRNWMLPSSGWVLATGFSRLLPVCQTMVVLISLVNNCHHIRGT